MIASAPATYAVKTTPNIAPNIRTIVKWSINALIVFSVLFVTYLYNKNFKNFTKIHKKVRKKFPGL